MILDKLILDNFRQFHGKHTMNFSSGDSNIIVVYGENGRGKTSIFRALMFCLYGEKALTQDGIINKDEIYLVNTNEVMKAHQSKEAAHASVELSLRDGECQYSIKRSIKSMFIAGKIIEEPSDLSLSITSPDGNTKIIKDPGSIASHIQNILDRRVREYFLFDGERIEHLTRASVKQKKEVSLGVRNLLKIDALEIAIKSLGKLSHLLRDEIATKATGKLAHKSREINELSERLESNNSALLEIEDEMVKAEAEIADYDEKLKEYDGVRELVEKRTIRNEAIQRLEEEYKDINAQIREGISNFASLLCIKTIQNVHDYINGKIERGEIPSEIRRDFIEKLISEGTCICGTPIEAGSSEFDSLKEWVVKSTESELNESALKVWNDITLLVRDIHTNHQKCEIILQGLGKNSDEISRLRVEVDRITDEIGRNDREDATYFEKQRRSVMEKIGELKEKQINVNEKIQQFQKSIDSLKTEVAELEKEEGVVTRLSKRRDIAENAESALKKIYSNITYDARENIAHFASDYFQCVLDNDSKEIFSRIKISDDYSLEILDRHGHPTLANISAGQRHLVSISFIAALAHVASNGQLMEMPLFMDSPFGRLSLEHRKNLIRLVPQLCAQWILLATDTELRKEEGEFLQRTGRLGRFYRLMSTDKGESRIEEVSLDDAILTLKS